MCVSESDFSWSQARLPFFTALPFVCTSSEKKNGENPMDGLIPVDEISVVSKIHQSQI